MQEELKEKDQTKFYKEDLEQIGIIFSMARTHATTVAPADRKLMADLLNYETSLINKVIGTFTEEQKEELENEAKKIQELEKFKELDPEDSE